VISPTTGSPVNGRQVDFALDPLLYGIELPRLVRLFPMGSAVEIATNSLEIEMAARAMWSRYPCLLDSEPVKLRVAVCGTDADLPPTPYLPRGQEHLVSIVQGPDNFAVADLARVFAFACISRNVAADSALVIWHFLEPLVCLLLAARHFAQVHASCVSLNGRAILLCGDSGAGKTCLSYACACAGWTFVSGDVTQIVRSSRGRTAVGRPYSIRFRDSARSIFPELGHWPARRAPNGKLDIEADTAELGIEVTPQAQVSHIVFLNRDPACACANFSEAPRDAALAELERVIIYGHRELRAIQKETLIQLLELPVLRLNYSRLDDAERALRVLQGYPV
jgi:hypothetical protein